MDKQGPHEPKELMEFPCSYSLKVIGKNTNEFYSIVSAIVERHLPEGEKTTYADRSSRGEKYLSITATFPAQSRDQLMAIYEELNSHEVVLMTL